jgi:protein CpxP
MKKLFLISCVFIGLTTAAFAQTKTAPTDPVQKAKGLQKELKLSAEQTTKVEAIYKESAQKFDNIKVKEHGDTNKMLVDVGPLRKATIKKIKAVLTPGQAAKYDTLVKDSKNPNLNGGWSDGWS